MHAGRSPGARREQTPPYASTEITERVYTDVDPRWLREQVNRMSLNLSTLVPRVEDSRVRVGEHETPDHLGKSP
jgi:hypothetical protein